MLEELLNPGMYHYYDIPGIGFQPGSEVVTTHGLVERYHWQRSLNGGPKEPVTARQAEKSTGVKERRWANSTETVTSLAIAASKQALGIERMTPEETKPILDRVRLIIVNTSSPDSHLPGMAPAIAHTLGLVNAEVYDVRQACAALPYMLNMAIPMLESTKYGENDEALLISTDILSRVTDPYNYDTASLFADAAGALRLRKSRTRKLAYMQLESAGELADLIMIKPGQNHISMDGLAVYEEVNRRVPLVVQKFFNNTKLSMEDIDFVAFHQASGKVIDKLKKELHVPDRKTLNILHEYGNSSAASMIGVLKEAHESGRLDTGKKILLAGFGAGMEIGIGAIEWSMPNPHEPKKKRSYLIAFGHRLVSALRWPFHSASEDSVPLPQTKVAIAE